MSQDDVIAAKALFGAAACGLFAFIAPWIALLINRWAAAAVAALLSLAATTLVFVFNSHAHIGPKVNIRPDVLIYPLVVLAWLECAGLVLFAATKKSREIP